MRLRRTMVPALLAAALVASGCTEDTGQTQESPLPPLPIERVWPLTGLPGIDSDNQSQIITVKVDNSAAGRPRVGIGSAELVVQELVEGGVTRLAAMYHAAYPDQVGAVRSMRATDAGIVLPTRGTLASSGGKKSTRRALKALGVPLAVEEDDPGFTRAVERSIPYNLMLNVQELAASLPLAPRPETFLPFGNLPGDVAAQPADSITMSWPAATSRFDYDPKSEQWILDGTVDATEFAFTNVLAIFVPVEFTSGADAAGTPVPTMLTEGTGRAVLATAGQLSEVQWQKPSVLVPWRFTYQPVAATSASDDPSSAPDSAGSAPPAVAPEATAQADPAPSPSVASAPEKLTIPPGRTWIGLVPIDGGSVSSTQPDDEPPSQ